MDLAPWFPPAAEPIGEVWYHERNRTAVGPALKELLAGHGAELLGPAVDTPVFPLLAKFIFTADKLSVQVHPDDDYARRVEGQWGKIEAWYVLRAEPGARLALGLKERLEPERFREAASNGRIEQLLEWRQIRPGDVFVIYPGTIHALGAGVVLVEIQQNSDLTYRIYDYGRPRPLHLDQAVQVATLGPYPGSPAPVALPDGWVLLARTRYFSAELRDLTGPVRYEPDASRFHLLVVLEGRGALAGQAMAAGDCWFVPAAAAPFAIEPVGTLRLLRAYYPGGD